MARASKWKTEPEDWPLTRKREQFCKYYVQEGLIAKEAFIKAGFSVSPNCPGQAYRNSALLLNKPNVQKRCKELQAEIDANRMKESLWTREQSILANKYIYDLGKSECDRINAAWEETVRVHQEKLEECKAAGDWEGAERAIAAIIQANKAHRISKN